MFSPVLVHLPRPCTCVRRTGAERAARPRVDFSHCCPMVVPLPTLATHRLAPVAAQSAMCKSAYVTKKAVRALIHATRKSRSKDLTVEHLNKSLTPVAASSSSGHRYPQYHEMPAGNSSETGQASRAGRGAPEQGAQRAASQMSHHGPSHESDVGDMRPSQQPLCDPIRPCSCPDAGQNTRDDRQRTTTCSVVVHRPSCMHAARLPASHKIRQAIHHI
jgi:hypothetical protein